MHEPKVTLILPPESEPLCRVGIILPEDDKQIVEISSLNPMIINGVKTPPGKLLIGILDDHLNVKHNDSNSILVSHVDLIKISAEDPNKSIFSVHDVVAGRSFHWKKNHTIKISGSVEIHRSQDKLIVVNEIGFEDYIAAVVGSEMGPECPPEFIKAQAISARSWAYVFTRNKHPNMPYAICNDDCCQRYHGFTYATESNIESAKKTSGIYLLLADGSVSPAYYSKSCGGYLERAIDSLGIDVDLTETYTDSTKREIKDLTQDLEFAEFVNQSYPDCYCSHKTVPPSSYPKYLGAVDISQKYFRWHITYTNQELCLILSRKLGINVKKLSELKAIERGRSGRITKLGIRIDTDTGEMSKVISSQYEIRNLLSESFLLSSAFVCNMTVDGSVNLNGAGWGHGVGLCQIGGVGMALKDHNYSEIMQHYFSKCTLTDKLY